MNILDRIKNGEVLICDGGMGTELQKRGLPTGGCPEAYNISHPHVIEAIHGDYYSAGSDIVETNSFGGSTIRLSGHGHRDKTEEYNKAAAQIAQKVCPAGKYVAGSIGPTGSLMMPIGDLSMEEVYNVFAQQAKALQDGGADMLFIETMMDIEEAVVALKAAKASTSLPVSATMTYDKTAEGVATSFGVTPEIAVNRLTEAGADIIGANCGNGIEIVIEVMHQLRPLTDLPLLAQPNAGVPEIKDGKTVFLEGPEDMKPGYQKLLDIGVNLFGGCCGTNPQHIKMLRGLVG